MTGIGAGLVQEVVWFFNLRDVIFASQDMINLNGAQIISKSEFLNYFVTIGASGAVFGILLAFAMIFPNVPLYLMFIPVSYTHLRAHETPEHLWVWLVLVAIR